MEAKTSQQPGCRMCMRGDRDRAPNVAELSRHSIEAARELPVRKNSGADTFGDGNDDQILVGLHIVEPNCCEDAGIGCVL